ncbi:MAG: hypothetical protein A2W28_08835 [Gammaproteobacteria bacterium RBG_16_51_14]|nr:MAG: hypothetical protein A2W28_08835 [Gammaproteobacteria bacterium RBG_16_51_14]
MNEIHALILAAGRSGRFGSPKQLARYGDTTLIGHSIRIAGKVLADRITVVLGANAELIRASIDDQAIRVIENNNWQNGLASSICCGIEALPSSCAAVLILLCDQPLLNERKLRSLVDAWMENPSRIIASQYDDTFGVPAVFPAACFPALLQLRGDTGARQLLIHYQDHVQMIALPEAGVDIDYAADLAALNEQPAS